MCPVVFKQALASTIGILIRSLQRVSVVVEFEITDAIIANKTVDHAIEICPDLRVPKIEQVQHTLDHPLAVAHEKPTIRLVGQT